MPRSVGGERGASEYDQDVAPGGVTRAVGHRQGSCHARPGDRRISLSHRDLQRARGSAARARATRCASGRATCETVRRASHRARVGARHARPPRHARNRATPRADPARRRGGSERACQPPRAPRDARASRRGRAPPSGAQRPARRADAPCGPARARRGRSRSGPPPCASITPASRRRGAQITEPSTRPRPRASSRPCPSGAGPRRRRCRTCSWHPSWSRADRSPWRSSRPPSP